VKLFVLLSVIGYANKASAMELRQIRSFLSITETLHFGRTAELIHLSQPALSLQIRALEEEVGARLFERNRRKTTLTAAGVAFRVDAAAAISQLDQATRKARLAAKGKLGLLRIGFISTAGSEIVPNIIRQFSGLNPEVEFYARYYHGGSGTDAGDRVARHWISSSADWWALGPRCCHSSSRTVRTRGTRVP
jgi:hypothetical protein